MDTTERLVLDLPTELVAKLREQVVAGDFSSESELVSAVLRGLYGPDIVDGRPADEIRAFVAEGLADIEAGRIVDADEVFDRLEARYQAMADRDR
jgi:antitoxin ParD1/3/4